MDNVPITVDNLLLGWRERKEHLKNLVKGKDFDSIQECFFSMHKDIHFGATYGGEPTICDYIWQDITPTVFSSMPIKKYMTIAWCFWHLHRIEDIISNIVIAAQDQIFNEAWLVAINSGITDTANAVSYKETVEMSKKINMLKLKEYCIEVSKNTVRVVTQLKTTDLQRKPTKESLCRIMTEGGLTEQKKSVWLQDFWGKKIIAGLRTLPLTDHHMMHLPGCLEIIKECAIQ